MRESSRLNTNANNLEKSFNFDLTSASTNLYFLIGIFAITTIGIGLPFTREATIWILDENKLVEVLTFIFCLIAGGIGLYFSYQLVKNRESFFMTGFYFLFSMGFIFIGMEEVSWGQQFLGFETPESFREMNEQGETTLHNIKGLSGNSEYLRLFYGICGAIGVFLFSYKHFRKVAAPIFLLPWFILIALHSKVDIFNDIVPIHKNFDAYVSEMAELVEMLIACSALIYVYFKFKNYRQEEREN